MAEELVMPRLSDTMEEGTIGRWLKREGDAFAEGDVGCQRQHLAPELANRHLEGHARAERGFVEEQRHVPAGERSARGRADAACSLLLQPPRKRQHRLHLARSQVEH